MRSFVPNRSGRRWPGWMVAVLLPGLVFFAGCKGTSHPKTIKVKGKVTYKGAPVSQGSVSFQPVKPAEGYPNRPATGILNSDGTFEMSSFEAGDGVVPGEYKVAIESITSRPSPEEPDKPEVWAIPKKYGNAEEGGLTATIAPDAKQPMEMNFDLTD
jgi:hypothetical protein